MRIITAISLLMCSVLFSCKQKDKIKDIYTVSESAKEAFLKAEKNLPKYEDRPSDIFDGPKAIFTADSEDEFIKGDTLPIPCHCAYQNDTLEIMSGHVYNGGFYYVSFVSKGKFKNMYSQYSDIPQLSKSDTLWDHYVRVDAVEQSLTLSKKEPFREGEDLYGIFEITAQPYYKKSDDKSEKHINKVKVYFLCKIQYYRP